MSNWSGFDWTNYFILAEELAQRNGEAAKRSAVSRAYYAMFCNARNALEIRDLFDRNDAESHHKEVWDTFEEGPQKEWKRIGTLGHELRELRRQADYDEQVSNLLFFTDSAIRRARKLHSALQSL